MRIRNVRNPMPGPVNQHTSSGKRRGDHVGRHEEKPQHEASGEEMKEHITAEEPRAVRQPSEEKDQQNETSRVGCDSLPVDDLFQHQIDSSGQQKQSRRLADAAGYGSQKQVEISRLKSRNDTLKRIGQIQIEAAQGKANLPQKSHGPRDRFGHLEQTGFYASQRGGHGNRVQSHRAGDRPAGHLAGPGEEDEYPAGQGGVHPVFSKTAEGPLHHQNGEGRGNDRNMQGNRSGHVHTDQKAGQKGAAVAQGEAAAHAAGKILEEHAAQYRYQQHDQA